MHRPLPSLVRRLHPLFFFRSGVEPGNKASYHSLCIPVLLFVHFLSLQMTAAETEEMLEELGIPRTESGGFPYADIIPYLVQAIEGP